MLLLARIYLPEQLQSMVVGISMLPMNMVPVYSHHLTFLVQSPRELAQASYFLVFFRVSACVASNLICSLLWLILSFSLVKLFYLYSHVREQRLHQKKSGSTTREPFSQLLQDFFMCRGNKQKNYSNLEIPQTLQIDNIANSLFGINLVLF